MQKMKNKTTQLCTSHPRDKERILWCSFYYGGWDGSVLSNFHQTSLLMLYTLMVVDGWARNLSFQTFFDLFYLIVVRMSSGWFWTRTVWLRTFSQDSQWTHLDEVNDQSNLSIWSPGFLRIFYPLNGRYVTELSNERKPVIPLQDSLPTSKQKKERSFKLQVLHIAMLTILMPLKVNILFGFLFPFVKNH